MPGQVLLWRQHGCRPHLGAQDAGAVAHLGGPLQHQLALVLNHLHTDG